jgi:hypothetical protein
MVRLPRGVEFPGVMSIDCLHDALPRKIIGPLFSAASVTMRAAAWTFCIVCSDFGISFTSQAIASLSVRSFPFVRQFNPLIKLVQPVAQWRVPSLSKSTLNCTGNFGVSPVLHSGQGAPAAPQTHAYGPSQGQY